MSSSRRMFLKRAALSVAVLGSKRLGAAAGSETVPPAHRDLVDLLIDSDRDRLPELLVSRIRAGLEYPTLLGAIAEAAARQVRPYPHVGFKYHAFMVLQAVDLTTQFGRPEDRWLPVLWSADTFKASQAAEQRLGPWSLGPVPERSIPAADKAESAFRAAMDRWDGDAADAAVIGLLQSSSRDPLFEILYRYGARDFRAIGHKAITVANCHRLFDVVGSQHAEAMLRSLVLALMNHGDGPNPAESDLSPDRPWRRNVALARQTKKAAVPKADSVGDGIAPLLAVFREGSDEDASRALLASLNQGVSEADVWTAIFAAAGEQMIQKNGIIAVHANTTANALHHAYRHLKDPEARRLILLQAASFMPLFRDLLGPDRRDLRIDTLEEIEQSGDGTTNLEDIFETVSFDRVEAARKTLGYLSAGGAETPFLTLARHYVVDRNAGYHDYKLAEAAFENAAAMRSPWRERYLASAVLFLNGSADAPNETVARARGLLG